jgi:hypothetical protein
VSLEAVVVGRSRGVADSTEISIPRSRRGNAFERIVMAKYETAEAALAGLEKTMNDAIIKNVEMQEKGILFQEKITEVNVKLAQVGTRASKQVPQG